MTHVTDSNPLVSVVIPTYNSANLITETLNSVQRQTYQNLEIIVVDDGSTDNTEYLVRQIAKFDSRIRYKKIQNSRSPTARNVGFKMAQGEYLCSIDSDDLWPPEKVQIQIETLNGNPDAVVLGCVQHFSLDSHGTKKIETVSCPPSMSGNYVHNLLSMHHNQMVNLNTLCAKRTTICSDGLWDPEVRTAHDWEVWIRLAKKYPFIHVNDILQEYRQHHASATSSAKWQTALAYQLLVVDRHSPKGFKYLWKRLNYRKIRYHCYISILIYENQTKSATKLWFHSALRSNMLFTASGLKLLPEIAIKAIRSQAIYSTKTNV